MYIRLSILAWIYESYVIKKPPDSVEMLHVYLKSVNGWVLGICSSGYGQEVGAQGIPVLYQGIKEGIFIINCNARLETGKGSCSLLALPSFSLRLTHGHHLLSQGVVL